MTTRTWRPDGPGSFQAPAGVHTVTDQTDRRWTKRGARWTCTGTHFVAEHGPATEAD